MPGPLFESPFQSPFRRGVEISLAGGWSAVYKGSGDLSSFGAGENFRAEDFHLLKDGEPLYVLQLALPREEGAFDFATAQLWPLDMGMSMVIPRPENGPGREVIRILFRKLQEYYPDVKQIKWWRGGSASYVTRKGRPKEITHNFESVIEGYRDHLHGAEEEYDEPWGEGWDVNGNAPLPPWSASSYSGGRNDYSCFISPNGILYQVPFMFHGQFAKRHGGAVDDLVRAGWIHISNYGGHSGIDVPRLSRTIQDYISAWALTVGNHNVAIANPAQGKTLAVTDTEALRAGDFTNRYESKDPEDNEFYNLIEELCEEKV